MTRKLLSALFACILTLASIASAYAGTPPVLGKAEGGLGNFTGDLSGLTVLPSNGSTPRTLSDVLADQINLKFIGGKNDLTSVTACAIAAASTALNCPTATFTSADVTKHIDVTGAAGPNTDTWLVTGSIHSAESGH